MCDSRAARRKPAGGSPTTGGLTPRRSPGASAEVFLRNLRPGDVHELRDLTHLVDVDAEVRARAHEAVRVGRSEAVLSDEPVHEVEGRGLDRDFERLIREDRHD